MINHKYKFIFTRVAKTASTSVLEKLPKAEFHCENWTSKSDPNHIPLWYMKENIDKDIYNNYYKFAFVRNPFARAVSIVKFCNKYPEWEGVTFRQFFLDHFPVDGRYSKYHSQYDFTEGCDFIGRFENLQEDFNIICDKIGIPRQQLPHTNKTKHKHYTEYYDDETKQIVAEIYARDIEHFGYEFGE